MPPEKLLEALRDEPFRPFRIGLTDGTTLDIRHPEMVILGRRSAVIALPTPGEAEPFYDRTTTVDLLHVVSLDRLEPSKPNGQS